VNCKRKVVIKQCCGRKAVIVAGSSGRGRKAVIVAGEQWMWQESSDCGRKALIVAG
jgi:hypothetical protein